MKKLFTLLAIFVFALSQSQTPAPGATETLTSKSEKITFKQYDDLKYIQNKVSLFQFDETITTFYSQNVAVYSYAQKVFGDYKITFFITLLGSIEGNITNTKDPKFYIQFNVMKILQNKYASFVHCQEGKCTTTQFINDEKTYQK